MAEEKKIKEAYLKQRMENLGIDLKDITVKFSIPKKSTRYQEHQKKNQTPFSFFTGDEFDNIQIHYFRPQTAERYRFEKKSAKYDQQFIRTRLKNPIEDKEKKKTAKYLSPKGSGLAPFFPPQLIQSYMNDEVIKTLVITEGEFKAFKASYHGMPTIGLCGIEGFYSAYDKGQIHEDILDFIQICQVENVIFLTDADTLTVNYEKTKDLKQRPFNFYNAVRNFYKCLEKSIENPNNPLINLYYLHIRTKFHEEAKGLDDLLVKFKGKEQQVFDDLKEFKFAAKYFNGFDLTDGKTNLIYQHFGLSSEEDFYKTYKDFIGSRPFRFGRRVYEWTGEEVKYLQHEDTEKYCRIGPDWYKEVIGVNKHGVQELELKKWKIGEIQRDYAKYPDFIDNIPKYDGFCSEPDFTENYKRVHAHFSGCELRNVYDPLMHTPAPGEFPTTKAFLKHIFGGEADFENNIEGDPFTVALDYLTIQFQNPKQMLPVPILVSSEFGTGKSTFIKWLQAVYVGNTVLLNNEMFKLSFNSHYITKYLICIDESFLDVDKKAEKERLKQLVTADTAFLQYKGVDVNSFIYYGKLIMCSNDAETIMKMEDGEDRWFVIKVPVPKTKDPDLETKLNAEIPAWLNFLKDRPIFHKKEERFWFKKQYIITEQYKLIVQGTKTRSEKILEEFLADQFLTFGMQEIKMNADFILERVNRNIKYKIDAHELRRVLEDIKGLKKEDRHRYESPVMIDPESNVINFAKFNAKPYVFTYDKWLDAEQLEEFKRIDNTMKFPHLESQEDKDDVPF